MNNLIFHGLSDIGEQRYKEVLENFNRIFSPYLKPDDWCIDIGANSGDNSLVLGSLVGPSGKVICFEPDLVAFHLLNQNVRANNFSDFFDLFNFAASDRAGKASFISSPSHDNGGFMSEKFSEAERGASSPNCEVSTIDIDQFLKDRYGIESLKENLKLIKIDTEGFDTAIVSFLKNIIQEVKPIIVIEWWNFEPKNEETIEAIKSINYMAFRDDNFEEEKDFNFKTKSENLILLPQL